MLGSSFLPRSYAPLVAESKMCGLSWHGQTVLEGAPLAELFSHPRVAVKGSGLRPMKREWGGMATLVCTRSTEKQGQPGQLASQL